MQALLVRFSPWLTSLSLLVAGSLARAETLPASISKMIVEAYPGARVLASKACSLGASKTAAFGALIQRSGPPKSGSNPLEAVIVFKRATRWTLWWLPHRMQYSRGSDSDFLRDFWEPKGLASGFEIRCISPKTDKDVSTQANGAFEPFASGLATEVRHLCFSASTAYNSWNCFTINPVTSAPASSFVQMNAD